MALDPSNPFATPSTLDYGLPPLTEIRIEHFLPAITEGLAQQRTEWEAIATNPDAPTFANTVEALERSGELAAPRRSHVLDLRLVHRRTRARRARGEGHAAPVRAP